MVTDLPTSPANFSLLLRQMADMLDELHARRAGSWGAHSPPPPTPDETIPFATEPRGSPLTRRVQLLRQVLDEAGPDVLSRGSGDERALIAAGLLDVVLCEFDDRIPRNCLTSSAALEAMAEPDVYALAAATLDHEPEPDAVDDPPSTVRTEPPGAMGEPVPDSDASLSALTRTQHNLLRAFPFCPGGIRADKLRDVVGRIIGGEPNDQVMQVYRAAMNTLVSMGEARVYKVRQNGGAADLYLSKDAPPPSVERLWTEPAKAAVHRPATDGAALVMTEDGHRGCIVEGPQQVDRVLDDLRAHPRSTATEVVARTGLAAKDVKRALKAAAGEGHGRGKRYSVREGAGE